MCMQCVAGAMAAGASATGMRAWLVARFGHLMTPGRKRALTVLLLGAGVIASGLVSPTP
jgi:cytochrome c-type biogenesis protein CcmH/NrfF